VVDKQRGLVLHDKQTQTGGHRDGVLLVEQKIGV